MLATRLVVIRHGETAWNAAGRLQGHRDIPLNALGQRQAAGLAPTQGIERDVLVALQPAFGIPGRLAMADGDQPGGEHLRPARPPEGPGAPPWGAANAVRVGAPCQVAHKRLFSV